VKKTFGSIFLALLLLTLVAGAAFAATAVKEKMLDVTGTVQAVENDEVYYPIIYLHGNGSGSATVLGQFTLHFEGIVSNDANGVGTGVEGVNLTVSNGDILFATATGLGVPTTTPGVNKIVEKYTVTGGTGQFESATGDFTVERLVTLPTGVSSGTIKGNIKLRSGK